MGIAYGDLLASAYQKWLQDRPCLEWIDMALCDNRLYLGITYHITQTSIIKREG